MNEISNSLIFFGSGPVAAKSLLNLINHFTIQAIVTKKLPAGQKQPSELAIISQQHHLPLFFVSNSQDLSSTLDHVGYGYYGLVIDFGLLFPVSIINRFSGRLLNSHFSLLPEWRGADPISYALLSGQIKTGVSLMLVDQTLDTGAILAQSTVLISPTDTNQSLTQKLIDSSNSLINQTLPSYFNNQLSPHQQTQARLTYSKLITKANSLLDFQKPATVLEREIRAYSGWPGSHCQLGNIDIVVTQAAASQQLIPSQQIIIQAKSIIIGCRVGSLILIKLKPIGRNNMSVVDFLNGYRHQLTTDSHR